MKKKKDEITIRSSAAKYLTYVASVGDQQDSIEMRYEDENIWLTQKMMATLYDVDVRTINEHIKKNLKESRENMSEKLLIVEDDKKLNDGIRLALKNDAYFFYQCRTLQEAREILKKEDITLVLLDVNLPDGNGIDFVREIRKNSQVPIILLTVNNMEVDIVTGLEAGANDYITKPFSLMVLRARVSVQLRNKEAAAKNSMELDGFEFYFDKMEFFKDGEPIELSKTEQKLLRVLCENRGKVLKREYLIDEVWQGDTEFVDAHALTVAIKRLRDKLEDDVQKPKYIKTVYGIGYIWAVKE